MFLIELQHRIKIYIFCWLHTKPTILNTSISRAKLYLHKFLKCLYYVLKLEKNNNKIEVTSCLFSLVCMYCVSNWFTAPRGCWMHFLAKNIKTEIVLVSYCLGETAHLCVSENIAIVCIKFVKNVHGHTVIKQPALCQ